MVTENSERNKRELSQDYEDSGNDESTSEDSENEKNLNKNRKPLVKRIKIENDENFDDKLYNNLNTTSESDNEKLENNSKIKQENTNELQTVGNLSNENIDNTNTNSESEIQPKTKIIIIDGVEYTYKERAAVQEERKGLIEFRVVNNDNSPDNMIILTGLKNIFQRQLPKMPREYISRLVFDKSHLSIAIVEKNENLKVVGGITYRPFESRNFAEIVFCAIASSEQVKGYGAHLMNHLKDYVKATSYIYHFLTYADNYAIGYFKKQGFTKDITLDKTIWMGYIKDYEGGTLMQCTMLPKVKYLQSQEMLIKQKAAIWKKIREFSKSHVIHNGLEEFKKYKLADGSVSPDITKFKPLDPLTIPGLKEAGWTPEMDELSRRPKKGPHFAAMQHLLSELQNHQSSWPFSQPVNKDEVLDYYEIIKEPMDFNTMEQKLDGDYYTIMDDFIHDARLIFKNCRSYNNENTTYYKHANKLEKFLNQRLSDMPEYAYLMED